MGLSSCHVEPVASAEGGSAKPSNPIIAILVDGELVVEAQWTEASRRWTEARTSGIVMPAAPRK